MQGYPDRIASETHHAACFLPPAAAVVLNARPALVAAAVRALGGKDPGELAGLGKGDDGWRFPPGPLVPVWLPFAQRAYGQLQCEEAQPPKAFLGPVAEVMAREGAAAAAAVAGGGGGGHSRGPVSGERVQSALERGVRLACGLEMLYRRSRRRARGTPPPGHGAPSSSSLSWQAYLSRLQARGFFEGVIEGSADHKARVGCARQAFDRRERQARAQRLARAVPEPGGGSSSPSPSPSPSRPLHEWVDELLAAAAPAQVAPSAFPASIAALPPDDDEGWLEIEASQLEAMVARYGQGPEGAEGMMAGQHGAGLDDEEEEDSDDESGDGEGDEDLEALLEGMKGFVGAMGGLEGAEPMGGGASAPAAPVSFDVDRLLSILQGKDVEEALRRGGISSDDEEDSDEEEGQAMMDEDGGVVGSRRVAGVGAGVFRMREVPRGGESDVDSDDGPSAVAAAEERMAEDGEGGGGEAVMMEAYMAHLDRELQGTTLDASFERVPTATAAAAAAAAEVGTEGEGAELPPVDLDLNLVRHLLESVASQGGAPGPATNILGELGFGHTRGGK